MNANDRINNPILSPLSDIYLVVIDESVNIEPAEELLAWALLNFGGETVTMPFINQNGEMFTVVGSGVFYVDCCLRLDPRDLPPNETGKVLSRFFPWKDAAEYPSEKDLEHELKYEYQYPLTYILGNKFSFDIFPGAYYLQFSIYYYRLILINRALFERHDIYKCDPNPQTLLDLNEVRLIRRALVTKMYDWMYGKRLN